MDERGRVRSWFQRNGGRFGMSGAPVVCRAVLNLGGFTNRSFTLGDGRVRLHLKLAGSGQAPLPRRWMDVQQVLEAEYRSPRLLGVVEGGVIAGEALGLVFEHIPGHALHPRRDRRVLTEVLALAARLHRDTTLGGRLGAAARGVRTCAADLLETYVERFRADMLSVAPVAAALDFLPADFPTWARSHTDALEAAAAGGAFAVPATAVVHGDFHAGNVLVGGDGRWWVLDWDDLHARGDGMLDVTNLMRAQILRGEGDELLAAYAQAAGDPAGAGRVALYRRAMLLDEIIDSLADYVASEALPQHRAAVRAIKRTAHLEAMALYKREFTQ